MESAEARNTTIRGGLSRESIRERRDQLIADSFQERDPVLIEALPSIGKSYGVVGWAAKTGNPISVFTARHDLYEQYTKWCEEKGLRSQKLPSFHYDCETANGEYGEEWEGRVTKKYDDTGLLPGELHRRAKDLFGEQLPCQQESECSYFTNRDFDPDEFDVLIGHYRHAHVPERIEGRYVVFDEFPEDQFLIEYPEERVTTAVNEYLGRHSDLPFSYLKNLREHRRDPQKQQEGADWFRRHNPDLSRDVSSIVIAKAKNGNAHSEAATLVYAILTAEDLDNHWEYTQLPDGRPVVCNPYNNHLTVLERPTLDGAKSVVALDGTPTMEKWRLMLGDDLRCHSVLSYGEKRDFLRYTHQLRVIQTTGAIKPYSSGEYVTAKQDLVLFESICDRERIRPALISSSAALEQYEAQGLADLIGRTKYYGKFKGSNTFESERVGIIAGSPHYGDAYIEKWAALVGKSVSRTGKGWEQTFGPFGDKILYGMRENEVLQAILRFGRDGEGATVYVHTAALPKWIDTENEVEKIHRWPDGLDEMVAAIRSRESDEWTMKEVESMESVDLSYEMIRRHHHRLNEYGYISKRREGRGFVWKGENLDRILDRGHVEWKEPK